MTIPEKQSTPHELQRRYSLQSVFVPRSATFEERLAARVEVGLCWRWLGATDDAGYGRVQVNKKLFYAHRWVWTNLVGPIPVGLTIDHLCRNHPCVNPDHLEVVTQAENNRRGYGLSSRNARKTHCPQGHPYDDRNTYRTKRRYCRECNRLRGIAWRERQRLGQLPVDPATGLLRDVDCPHTDDGFHPACYACSPSIL